MRETSDVTVLCEVEPVARDLEFSLGSGKVEIGWRGVAGSRAV